MTLKEAQRVAGPLSNVSKMPWYSYGIPAKNCKTGRKLAAITGSTCAKCYAYQRGNYQYPSVQISQDRRLTSIDNPEWVEAMVAQIGHYTPKTDPYFRWHDSGDLQSEEHFEKIIQIAERLPWVQFYLPTQERRIVKRIAKQHPIPTNLIVRFSDPMVGMERPKSGKFLTTGVAPRAMNDKWHLYVVAGTSERWYCPAHLQGNNCGHCRRCWDSEVKRIIYQEH